jgi:hypothetical protein
MDEEIKDKRHWTRYIVNGKWVEKEKVVYSTDKEAIEKARLMNLSVKQIHKAIAYKCPICLQWHVGRSKKVLTEKDREHYRKWNG